MTIEEKAKAYDEALEKAKIEINTKGIGETVDLCEQLFPQLTESEDERIRKWLLDYAIEMIAALESDISLSTYDGIKGHDPEAEAELAQWQKARAYLERQKESLHIPETCKENANSFTDEDERIINQLITLVNSAGEVLLIPTNKEELVAWLNECKESLHTQEMCKENANSFADGIIEVRSFQRGMEEGRRLEKQKEQKPMRTAKEVWKEMRLEVYAQASGNRHEPNCSDDSTKMFSLCDIDEIFDKIGDSTVAPAEEDGPFDEDEFLEDELSAFLQNYDKEYDDDAAVSDVARHFYEIGKKQNEQKSVPFSCGHENGKQAEWAELRTEFNITEAFENGKKEVIDHPDKYGLTKQKPVESIEGGVLTHLGNED